MLSSCAEALSPILVPAKLLGIRTSAKSPFLVRAWGLTFQLFFFAYTIKDTFLRWRLMGDSSDPTRSSSVIAATFDTVHGAYFVILVIVILHFNHRKSQELFDIFSVCSQVSANLNCDRAYFQKVKSKVIVLSAFMNTAFIVLYLCDNITWLSQSNSLLYLLHSNIITTTWVTCELVFLSVVYSTHQLFAQLNSKMVILVYICNFETHDEFVFSRIILEQTLPQLK
jgi:hypothetical protein